VSDLRQLVGKRVLMTGGSGNIGRASALLMAEHGATVTIGDLDLAGAQATVDMITAAGGKALAVQTDVTNEASVAALVAAAVEFMGGIDVGFFNAGLQRSGRVEEFPSDEWDALFQVNPRHSFYMAKHTVPHLRKNPSSSIVLTSSVAGVKGGPGMTAYSASKGAIVGFGRALAAELAGDNIRVNNIPPGFIDTPMLRETAASGHLGPNGIEAQIAATPVGRPGRPEDMAAMCAFLVSEEAGYITGQTMGVNGGRVTS